MKKICFVLQLKEKENRETRSDRRSVSAKSLSNMENLYLLNDYETTLD